MSWFPSIFTQGQLQCQDFMVTVSIFDTAMKSEEASRLMQGTGKKLLISTDIIKNMEQFTIEYICNDKQSNSRKPEQEIGWQ